MKEEASFGSMSGQPNALRVIIFQLCPVMLGSASGWQLPPPSPNVRAQTHRYMHTRSHRCQPCMWRPDWGGSVVGPHGAGWRGLGKSWLSSECSFTAVSHFVAVEQQLLKHLFWQKLEEGSGSKATPRASVWWGQQIRTHCHRKDLLLLIALKGRGHAMSCSAAQGSIRVGQEEEGARGNAVSERKARQGRVSRLRIG